MPRILESYDDLDWADGQRRTLAGNTLTVGLDGEVAELVLSDDNAEKVRKYLRDLIAIGRKVDTKMPRPSGQTKPIAGTRAPKDKGLVEYRKGLRKWVDANGIRNPKDPSLPAYKSQYGNWNYSRWLTDQYDAWLADQQRMAENERTDRDTDPAER